MGENPFYEDCVNENYGDLLTVKDEPLDPSGIYLNTVGDGVLNGIKHEPEDVIKVNFCSICQKKFFDLWTLRRHKKSMHGSVPVKCPRCDMFFPDKYSVGYI